MILVVGLGNPSKEYAFNRHNVGFMAADTCARRFPFNDFKSKHQGLLAEGEINGQKTLLLKPQTYMNLSGQSVGAVARFYKIAPENIIVFHDDLDLKPLDVRIKQGGSPGGHNGLKSIDAAIGNMYWRIRVGIGHPGDKAMVADYVLSNFSKQELNALDELLDKLVSHLPILMAGDATAYRTKIGE